MSYILTDSLYKSNQAMNNRSPISNAPATAHLETRSTYRLRVLRCRDAASKAHDPDFKRIWLKHAEDLRATYRKGLQ
jgi:hypothetical protein